MSMSITMSSSMIPDLSCMYSDVSSIVIYLLENGSVCKKLKLQKI